MITRRSFLQLLGATGTLAALSPSLLLEPVTFDATDMRMLAEFALRELEAKLLHKSYRQITAAAPANRDLMHLGVDFTWKQDDVHIMEHAIKPAVNALAQHVNQRKWTGFAEMLRPDFPVTEVITGKDSKVTLRMMREHPILYIVEGAKDFVRDNEAWLVRMDVAGA